MEVAVCKGYVQVHPSGSAICTDVDGNFLPWVSGEYGLPWWVAVGAGVGMLHFVVLVAFLFGVFRHWFPGKSVGSVVDDVRDCVGRVPSGS